MVKKGSKRKGDDLQKVDSGSGREQIPVDWGVKLKQITALVREISEFKGVYADAREDGVISQEEGRKLKDIALKIIDKLPREDTSRDGRKLFKKGEALVLDIRRNPLLLSFFTEFAPAFLTFFGADVHGVPAPQPDAPTPEPAPTPESAPESASALDLAVAPAVAVGGEHDGGKGAGGGASVTDIPPVDPSSEREAEIPAQGREIFVVEAEEEEFVPEGGSSREGPGPETPPPSRPEPGPVPVGDEVAGSRVEIPASSNIFDRARAWIREKARATDAALGDYDIYRAHIRGEVTGRERDGTSPTLSLGAMFAGGALSGVLSYFGAALPFDAIRYAAQRHFTGVEREEITEAFRAALAERRARAGEALEGDDVRERVGALRQRVEASRYLTDTQKADLLSQLEEQQTTFAAREEPHGEHLNREVGRILEHAIRTRVTGEKVTKEALNTLFMVSGVQFLRAPTYGAISLYGRWRRLTRENPHSSAGERLRSTISGGFTEWWDQAKGKKGRLAQAAAFGTAARFVGVGATFVEATLHTEAIGELLNAWEHKESAFPPEAHNLSDYSAPDIERNFTVHTEDVVSTGQDARDHAVSIVDHATHAHTSAAEVHEGTLAGPADDFGESVSHDDIATEVVLAPEHIPSEALVRHGDGVTQTLLATIEARPDLLNATDRAALHDDYTTALFLRRLAAKDGLLDYWLSEKAIGNVAIVPQYEGGEAHIAFLNPDTGSAYSFDELQALGWLVKAPKKAL